MPKIDGVPKTRPFLDDMRVLNTEGRAVFEQIESRVLITGLGTPEDMVSSVAGGMYANLNGTTGAILYVKMVDAISGDATKGWTLV